MFKHVPLARTAALFCAAAFAFVPALADCDTTGPALTTFSFTPSTVDVTTAFKDVTCTMPVTDSPAGVSTATCTFTYQSFLPPFSLYSQSCTASTPSSGTRNNGTFSCAVRIPRYSAAAVWNASVSLTDADENSTSLAYTDLLMRGLPYQLTVTDTTPDSANPVMTNFDFTPKSINVTSASQTVNCSITLTDSPAGITGTTCQFFSPSQTRVVSCSTAPAGNPTSGTFTCTLTFPRYMEAGTWTAFQATATDSVGNRLSYLTSDLTSHGWPTQLTVTDTSPDTTPPNLTAFSFTPASVDVSSAAKTVQCNFTITDTPAGVNFVSCQFDSPSGNQSTGCFTTAPSSGSNYTCTATIPAYSEGGTWSASLTASDTVQNNLMLQPADLAARGFPNALAVSCGAGDAETKITWSNRTTMVWTAIAGATRYNVYRGLCSTMKDVNGDGLPDGGFGTCQNSRDPNLTDTSFTEPTNPATKDSYFFLVSYTIGGVEKGLGTTSAGKPRTVASPCP